MKSLSVLLVVVLCALVQARPEDKYSTKYDSFDVDEVLNNRRLLSNYMNCVLGKGRCTKEGKELKAHVGEGLQTDCAKCSEKQKEVAFRVLKHLYEKEPGYFKQLEERFDEAGTYRKRYHERAQKEGIIL